nr:hypothetical protein [uncultured Ruegeria sp.]
MTNVIEFRPQAKRVRDRREDLIASIRDAVQVGFATARQAAAYRRLFGVDEHLLNWIDKKAAGETWRRLERDWHPGKDPRDDLADLAEVNVAEMIFALEGGFHSEQN